MQPAMTTVLLHCTLLPLDTAVCWMKIYVHHSHKFVWIERTFFFILSSWLISCFNSPIVLKMVGTYRQLSNLHAFKMFHMYGISSQELYINTLLSEKEEKSCINYTNSTDRFPVSCTLLQLLLSTGFFFFGRGGCVLSCINSGVTHILCLNLVSRWNRDQYIHDKLYCCIKCIILSLYKLQARCRCLPVMSGPSILAEVLIAMQKLLLGSPWQSCQVFIDTFCLNCGLQEEYNISMFKIHIFT